LKKGFARAERGVCHHGRLLMRGRPHGGDRRKKAAAVVAKAATAAAASLESVQRNPSG